MNKVIITNEQKEVLDHLFKKHRRLLHKVHKLKRENLILSDRRKSILQCKSNYNKAKYHYYCQGDFNTLFNLSEKIGSNGLKIQQLRTKIACIKSEILRKEVV